MPVYRVIPVALTADPLPPIGKAAMNRAAREELIRRLRRQREQGDAPRVIRNWIDRAGNRGVRLLPFDHIPAAGRISLFVEMPSEEADRMRSELTVVQVELIPGFSIPPPVVFPLPEKPPLPPGLSPSDLWHLRAIGLTAARRKGFTGTGKGVTVAELGTGMDESHPELQGKIKAAVEFDEKSGAANALAQSEDTAMGYGTHVAGLVCGTNVGVAPGTKLINGVTFRGGQGTLTAFLGAINWIAAQSSVQIVVIAAGFDYVIPEMNDLIGQLVAVGILPIVSVGNVGEGRTMCPGNCAVALSIGAATRKGKVSAFSSSGPAIPKRKRGRVPHVVAPGENVVSCTKGGAYQVWSGTSMAAPIAAGVAALILEKHPGLTVSQLKEAILSTCKDLGEPTERQGGGLVQVKAAL